VTEEDPEIPLYEGKQAVERAYSLAQQEGIPFFGIEQYDEGYAVTYDLLPADRQLVAPVEKEVRVRLTTEVEAVVGDSTLPTTEVSKSVNDSLGNVSMFASEAGARRVAEALAPLVLDSGNWKQA